MYYDPGNLVYMYAMKLMFNEIFASVNWNRETVGDIFESILGLYYLRGRGGKQCPITLVRMAEWLDQYISAIYEFMKCTGWSHVEKHTFQPWHNFVTNRLYGPIWVD